MTVHNLLFCVHTLCMSNVTKTFLLVSSSVSSKHCVLCTVKAKKENKNIEQRTLSSFISITLYWLWIDWLLKVITWLQMLCQKWGVTEVFLNVAMVTFLKEIKAASAYHNIAVMWYSVVMVILLIRSFEMSSSQCNGM